MIGSRSKTRHLDAITGKCLEHSFTFDYHEQPQQEKTMTGNDTDPEQPNEADVNQMTARALFVPEIHKMHDLPPFV